MRREKCISERHRFVLRQQKSPARSTEHFGATPFLAKSGGRSSLGGRPDLRRFADHSGGTVADSHGLPPTPSLHIVGPKSKTLIDGCQLNEGGSLPAPSKPHRGDRRACTSSCARGWNCQLPVARLHGSWPLPNGRCALLTILFGSSGILHALLRYYYTPEEIGPVSTAPSVHGEKRL
jgi:hypothetical protein